MGEMDSEKARAIAAIEAVVGDVDPSAEEPPPEPSEEDIAALEAVLREGDGLLDTSRAYMGVLSRFDVGQGRGFIECEEIKAACGQDVYVHQMVLSKCSPPANIGDTVSFHIHLNAKGLPQAAAPMEVLQEGGGPGALYEHAGTIKSFNPNKGYGFVECATTFEKYGRDVYLHMDKAVGYVVGQEVFFNVRVNQDNQPSIESIAPVKLEVSLEAGGGGKGFKGKAEGKGSAKGDFAKGAAKGAKGDFVAKGKGKDGKAGGMKRSWEESSGGKGHGTWDSWGMSDMGGGQDGGSWDSWGMPDMWAAMANMWGGSGGSSKGGGSGKGGSSSEWGGGSSWGSSDWGGGSSWSGHSEAGKGSSDWAKGGGASKGGPAKGSAAKGGSAKGEPAKGAAKGRPAPADSWESWEEPWGGSAKGGARPSSGGGDAPKAAVGFVNATAFANAKGAQNSSSEKGYAEKGYAEKGYAEKGYAEKGYAEKGYAEKGYAEKGYDGKGMMKGKGKGKGEFSGKGEFGGKGDFGGKGKGYSGPDLSQPSDGVTYSGVLKSFSAQNDYGFIECAETMAAFGRDVFTGGSVLPAGTVPGGAVSFTVKVNRRGMPEAQEVWSDAWGGGGGGPPKRQRMSV